MRARARAKAKVIPRCWNSNDVNVNRFVMNGMVWCLWHERPKGIGTCGAAWQHLEVFGRMNETWDV